MRFVDKIAKSKYFQKATETEFIKKKMEEVSNTPLLLTVEVQECRGTLAVNIPPPPTDRIWYVHFQGGVHWRLWDVVMNPELENIISTLCWADTGMHTVKE